jgi:RNA polymerase-associated protein
MMTLFLNPKSLNRYCLRYLLAEKDLSPDVVDMGEVGFPKKLIEHNPYKLLPNLVNRDLVSFGSRILMMSLNARYTHPLITV